jgi:hypothetical protein
VVLVVALVLAMSFIGVRAHAASPDVAGWQPIAWPFPRDAWPAGRAYHCPASACGADLAVYIRPKIGFCNCTTGVADDEEVDRVTDLDLIGPQFAPKAPGSEVGVADLRGRARDYRLQKPGGVIQPVEGIALSHQCDLIVAVVDGDAASERAQAAVHDLLTEAVITWVKDILDGR